MNRSALAVKVPVILALVLTSITGTAKASDGFLTSSLPESSKTNDITIEFHDGFEAGISSDWEQVHGDFSIVSEPTYIGSGALQITGTNPAHFNLSTSSAVPSFTILETALAVEDCGIVISILDNLSSQYYQVSFIDEVVYYSDGSNLPFAIANYADQHWVIPTMRLEDWDDTWQVFRTLAIYINSELVHTTEVNTTSFWGASLESQYRLSGWDMCAIQPVVYLDEFYLGTENGDPSQLNAQFTWEPTRPNVGETVQFSDVSTGAPTSWHWDFGDGYYSDDRNPTHAFSSSGTSTVSLTVEGSGETDTVTHDISVQFLAKPSVQFRFSPIVPTVGEEVVFTDQSSHNPTSWTWNFGDLTTSSEQNPVHTFAESGDYKVHLKASNSAGSSYRDEHVFVQTEGWQSCTSLLWTFPSETSEVESATGFSKVLLRDGLAYVTEVLDSSSATPYEKLLILDVSGGGAPEELSELYFENAIWDLAEDRERLYVAIGGHDGKLVIVDVSDPSNPSQLGKLETPTVLVTGVQIRNDQAIVSAQDFYHDSDFYLKVIDVSNPRNPVEIGSQEVGSGTGSVNQFLADLHDDLAYMVSSSSWGGNVQIWDISDPQSISRVGRTSFDYGAARDVAVSGDIAYLAHDWAIVSLDVSDPSSPRVIDTLNLPGAVGGVSISDSVLSVTGAWSGFFAVNAKEPDELSIVGAHDTAEANWFRQAVDSLGNMALVADHEHGLHAFGVPGGCVGPPVASFEWSSQRPSAGVPIEFQDTSSGSPTSWSWSFGDGGTSNNKHPMHTYQSEGSFEVTLNVANEAGSDSVSRTIEVTSAPPDHVAVKPLDDYRSSPEIEIHPNDIAYRYYSLTNLVGDPIEAAEVDYAVQTTGFQPDGNGLKWDIIDPGILRMTAMATALNLSGGSEGWISLESGSGLIELDGIPIEVTSSADPVHIVMQPSQYLDEWDVFAAASAGATGCLGACGSAGAADVSVAAAKLSVKGSSGMGLNFQILPDNSLVLGRRTEVSVAASMEMPSLSAGLGNDMEFSVSGLSAGLEKGFTGEQVFHYVDGDPQSDEARMMNAAFFLEAASSGGIVQGFYVGTLIKALAATLNGLSGANELLEQSLEEESKGSTLAGTLTAFSTGFSTPIGIDLGFSGPSMGAAIASKNAKLYGQSGAHGSVIGRRNDATLAVSGRNDIFNLGTTLPLDRIGIGGFTAGLTESLYVEANRNTPYKFSFSFMAQTGQDIDAGSFQTKDHKGQEVAIVYSEPAVVSGLVDDPDTGLKALTGSGSQTFMFGKQAFLGGVERINEIALAHAGTGPAYEVFASSSSGRIFSVEGEVGIPVIPPPTQVNIDVGLEFEYQHYRRVDTSGHYVVTGDDEAWPLLDNPSQANWRHSQSITSLVGSRFFSGIGPLIREAFKNLISFSWWPPWPFEKNASFVNGAIELEVEDSVRQRRAGVVTLDESLADLTGSVVSGDPSRLESTSGGTKLGWTYSTKRILDAGEHNMTRAQLRAKAATSTTVLRLVGQFIELNLNDGETTVTNLPVQGSLAFDLYQDQFAAMGGDWQRRQDVRVFRFDPSSTGWEQVGGSVAGNNIVTSSISRTGAYAPGLVTTYPANDSDGDGIPDDEEDLDGDGTIDPGETDPYSWDSDDDGISDYDELQGGTDPMDSTSTSNRAPILGYIGNRVAEVGENIDVPITAFDPDGDSLRFSAQGLPPSASINAQDGDLNWQPQSEGTWSVSVVVQDQPNSGTPLSDRETFLLIARAPTAPVESAGEHVYCVPASAHADGLEGTRWLTDAVVFNGEDDIAEINAYFLGQDHNNLGTVGKRVSVYPSESLSLGDIVGNTFREDSAAGSILFASDTPLIVNSRTFNDAPGGTFGQFVPGMDSTNALGGNNQEARLIQLTSNSNYRTNIGFSNAGDAEIQIGVALHKADGSLIQNRYFTLPPFGYLQATDIINQAVDDAYAIVKSNTSGAQYFTYASVVDDNSGDPIFVLPSEKISTGTAAYIAAAANAEGVGGSNWRTDLEIHNPGTARATYSVELLKKGVPNSSPQTQSFDLVAGRSRRFNNVLQSVFGYSGTAALRVTPTAGVVMVSSRTYNDAESGTFGQFIPAVTATSAVSGVEPGRLIQLAQSNDENSGFRSNLGLLNAGSQNIAVVVKLFDGLGSHLGTTSFDLAPFEYDQIGEIFGRVTNDNVMNGYATVESATSGAKFFAYGSVVDNSSGDPIFIPATVKASSLPPPPPPPPPPVAPNLTVTAISPSQIDLSWTSIAAAETYRVYSGTREVYNGPLLNASDTGLSANTEYCYTIRAHNEGGDGPQSRAKCATTQGGAPSAAPALTATTVSSSRIDLSWTSVAGATGYRLYRNGSQIYNNSGRQYGDTGRQPDTEYCYTVLARNNYGNGPMSQEVCATTAGSAPSESPILTATTISSTEIKLTWTSVAAASTYRLYRNGSQIYNSSGRQFNDTGRQPNTQYCYTVLAHNDSGNGPMSDQACATTEGTGGPPSETPFLEVASETDRSIQLYWNEVSAATGYAVYRENSEIYRGPKNTTIARGLNAKTVYCFQISAYNQSGEGPRSSDLCYRTADQGTIGCHVLAPEAGETWQIGDTHTIRWETANNPSSTVYSIQVAEPNPWVPIYYPIAEYTADDGSFDWTIDVGPRNTWQIELSVELGEYCLSPPFTIISK